MIQIEIEFRTGAREICDVKRKMGKGDLLLARKKQTRFEFMRQYEDGDLYDPWRGEYKWIDGYLKGTKSYQEVRIRRHISEEGEK